MEQNAPRFRHFAAHILVCIAVLTMWNHIATAASHFSLIMNEQKLLYKFSNQFAHCMWCCMRIHWSVWRLKKQKIGKLMIFVLFFVFVYFVCFDNFVIVYMYIKWLLIPTVLVKNAVQNETWIWKINHWVNQAAPCSPYIIDLLASLRCKRKYLIRNLRLGRTGLFDAMKEYLKL